MLPLNGPHLQLRETSTHCYYNDTNENGKSQVNLCEELKFRPVHQRFPQPRCRQWTWTHPAGSKQQLDHILINSKWTNSLRNCRAYNTVELDSDHRIVSTMLITSLRTSKGKLCRRPRFNCRKLAARPSNKRGIPAGTFKLLQSTQTRC